MSEGVAAHLRVSLRYDAVPHSRARRRFLPRVDDSKGSVDEATAMLLVGRTALWAIPWVLAMVAIVGSPAWGQEAEPADPVDFEGHPGNPIGSRYPISIVSDFYFGRGVRIEPGTVVHYEEDFTSSGVHGLEMCYRDNSCTAPFEISFHDPQQRVAVMVGYSAELDEPALVVIVALDAEDVRIAEAVVELEPGWPVRVEAELAVDDPAGRIRKVRIGWFDDSSTTKIDDSKTTNSLVIDDVQFWPPVISVEAVPDYLIFESTDSDKKEIFITNTGNVRVPFRGALDDPVAPFKLVETTCNEGLDPGASCTISVSFSSTEPGDYESRVVLRDTDDDNRLSSILIFGRHAPVESVEADQDHLVFESTDTDKKIVITNTGNVRMPFRGALDGPDAPFKLVETDCSEGLDPGASCEIEISFSSMEPGDYESRVVLRDTDDNELLPILIFGKHARSGGPAVPLIITISIVTGAGASELWRRRAKLIRSRPDSPHRSTPTVTVNVDPGQTTTTLTEKEPS